MARLDRDPAAEGPVVRGFADGGFDVEGHLYRALLLTPRRAEEWAPPSVAGLGLADLEPLLDLDPAPEFLLLGTGPRLTHPPRALREALERRGVGLEVMDSRAAARAWGLLRGEERWIAAALMPL
ncbi:MAG TPA: Mth938-like domain-containing protein [Allosphingosinicella sp.]|nr:Mth938-like domain-containing protein [Allosphingosinicella sp.]